MSSFATGDWLAKSDRSNAEWKHDLAVSNAKIADAIGKSGNGADALGALRSGHDIMVRLTALSPHNAGWKRDLDGFDAQIAELSQ